MARGSKKTESLWVHYRRTRSEKARNDLVERYRGFVEGMAMTLVSRLPRSVDVQDLTHAGVWGLMQAVESFEHERGTTFLSFMRLRVRGAMLDELRNMDYLPRLVRHRRRERDAAEVRLRQTLDRAPTDAELADDLGVSEAVLQRGFAAAPPPRRALPPEVSDRDGEFLDEIEDDQVESPLEALNRQELLAKIKASLQPIEWRVLELHYLDGLNGKEVAKRMRLSASRVCQIHGRVLTRLKARLRAHG